MRNEQPGCGRRYGTALSLTLVMLHSCSSPQQTNVAALRVVAAEELGVLEQSPTILGRDGGFSTLLWGTTIWVYGDTFLSKADEHGRTLLHNSFSRTEDLNAADGITAFFERQDSLGTPTMLLEPTPQEEAFNAAHSVTNCREEPCGARYGTWPTELVWDHARARALAHYSLIYAEPGAWNFTTLGSGLAEWKDPTQPAVRLLAAPSSDTPELTWAQDDPVPSQGPQVLDDYLYGFACPLVSLRRPCTLARAPLSTVARRESWTWYTGHSWSTEPAKASPLFEGNVAITVSFNSYLGRWMAIYARLFEDTVELRTAPELTGPWSEPLPLFTGDDHDEERWLYDAVAHASYAEENGRIMYVTYSRPIPGTMFSSELVLVRVVLE
ncbi:MAG: hypothetical protein A2284_05235 [Deltaproteobacteria bacterium RIFOXYA12_FULL_61_11]|nr:MAG: hypothetical protein A2284_05235 [Deltaproteobacteria bacterium RIFOXYA12_FULL_61_11]